jgi:tetratricopeptide (TPR) repeat protein
MAAVKQDSTRHFTGFFCNFKAISISREKQTAIMISQAASLKPGGESTMGMNMESRKISEPVGIFRANITPVERLIDTTVGRKEVLDDIVEKLRQNARKKNKQHFLFIGPRGIGKTHFLTLIENAVNGDSQLVDLYTIVRFPEENNRLLSFADMLLGITEILGDVTKDKEWTELVRTAVDTENDNEMVDTIEPRLRHYHKQTGKTLLIMIENLDVLLGQQMKRRQDVHRLRTFLMDQSCALMIGTSPVFFQGITDNKSPLYEFFDIQVLEDLSEDQTVEMIRSNLSWEGRSDLVENFESFIPKIQAIHIMTGGNPRLIMFLYELIAHDNLLDVKLQFQKLLDQISPFYQDRLKDLAPQERALLETMALMRHEPRTPANISKRMRKPPQQVSSMLKRMTDAGYLTSSDNPQDKRSKLYKIKEGFFDLWLAMSESRQQRKRLSFLVEFFEMYYKDKKEREEKRKELWRKIDTEEKLPDASKENSVELLSYLSECGDDTEQCRAKLELALHSIKEKKGENAHDLLSETMALSSKSVMDQWIVAQADRWLGGEAPLDIQKWLDDIIEYWRIQRAGDLEKAAAIALRLGSDLSSHGLHAIRIELLNEAVQLTDSPRKKIRIYQDMAESQFMDARPEDALESLKKALAVSIEAEDKKGIATTLHWLGNIHFVQGDYEKATEKYHQSLKISEEFGDKAGIAVALHQLGMIYQVQGDYEKATEKYNQSLKISEEFGDKGKIASSLHQLGMIHQDQGDYEKAIEKYNRSLKIEEELGDKSGIAYTLGQLGNIHFAQGHYEKAIEKYNQTMKISEEMGDKRSVAIGLHQLGNIYFVQGDYEKAIEKYNRSLKIKEELGDKSGIAISTAQLGRIYEAKEDYSTALRNYLLCFSMFDSLKSPHRGKAANDIKRLQDKIGEERFKEYFDEIMKEVKSQAGQ